MSAASPVLIPVFIEDYLHELDIMIAFAANYTSLTLNISSDTIKDILTSHISMPNVHPLTCVMTDLIFIRPRYI